MRRFWAPVFRRHFSVLPQDALLVAGDAALRRDALEEARTLFSQAVQASPQSIHAHNRLGFALASLDSLPEAQESFENALRFSLEAGDQGSAAVALVNVGNVMLRRGQTEQALSKIREAVEIHRSRNDDDCYVDTLLDYGRALIMSGMPEDALTQANVALEKLEQHHASEHFQLLHSAAMTLKVEALARLQRFEDGLALELVEPKLAATYLTRAGKPLQAASVLLPHAGEDPETLCQVGMLFLGGSDLKKAENVLRKAVDLVANVPEKLVKPLWLLAQAQRDVPTDAQKTLVRLLSVLKRVQGVDEVFRARVTMELSVVTGRLGLANQAHYHSKSALNLLNGIQTEEAETLRKELKAMEKKD